MSLLHSDMHAAKRILPLALVIAVLAGGYALGLQHYLSWAALGERQTALRAMVQANPVGAAAAYLAIYAIAVAASFPGALLITVAGGLLFGTLAGAAMAVCGATAGAVIIFLAARSALAPFLVRRAGGLLDRLRPGLQRDGFSYVLALRLIPVMPFWLINLAAALCGVRLAHFAVATFFGIIPATTVYASIGAGLGGVLAAGRTPDLSQVLSAPVLLPLLGLALLALLPVGWRRWQARTGRVRNA